MLKYRRAFAIGFACVIVTAAVGLAGPWVLKYAIDDLGQGVDTGKIAFYAWIILGLTAVGGFFRFVMRRIIIGASRDIEYDLRNDFFAHLQRLDLAYFQGHRTGDLMSRATNDLSAVRMMIGPAVMYSATTGLFFIVGIILMLSINPRLTLFALVPLPFVSISVGLLRRRHSPAVRAYPGAAVRDQRDYPGDALRRPRRPCLSPGAVRDRTIPAGERGVRAPQSRADQRARDVPAEHGFSDGHRRAARAVAWQPRSRRRTHDGRRARRIQLVFDDAVLADDCVRLGHQPAAARHGVLETDARGDGHARRPSPMRTLRARSPTRPKSAAESSYATSRFDTATQSFLTTSPPCCPPARRRRLSARPARGSLPCCTCSRASMIRRRERCSSTASTCGTFRCPCCAAPSASFRRSRSSLARRLPKTSPLAPAASATRAKRWKQRRRLPGSTRT